MAGGLRRAARRARSTASARTRHTASGRAPRPRARSRALAVDGLLCLLCIHARKKMKRLLACATLPLLTSARLSVPIEFLATNNSILANGEVFTIKGINWSGFENADGVLGGLGYQPLATLTEWIAAQGFNAIRLPLSVHNILSDIMPLQEHIHGWHNRNLRGLRYLQLVSAVVDSAARHHLLVMLDMHRLNRAEMTIDKLWYSPSYPQSSVVDAWRRVASAFCDAPNVFAADLFNEPYATTWGHGPAATDWRIGARTLADAVLGVCERWLIFVEGTSGGSLGCSEACSHASTPAEAVVGCPSVHAELQACVHANNCSCCAIQPIDYLYCPPALSHSGYQHFWGGNLEGVRASPLELSVPMRLVYSPHIYGPPVHEDVPYFRDAAYPHNLDAIWDAQFGNITSHGDAPVVIGEWGGPFADNSTAMGPGYLGPALSLIHI